MLLLKCFARLPEDLPDAVRDTLEETLAAVAERHNASVCRAQDDLEDGGRAAAQRYEDALASYHTDALNAFTCLLTRMFRPPTVAQMLAFRAVTGRDARRRGLTETEWLLRTYGSGIVVDPRTRFDRILPGVAPPPRL